MSIILEISGANEKEMHERHAALQDLNNDLSTKELQRLVELKNMPKARAAIKTDITFSLLKVGLKKF